MTLSFESKETSPVPWNRTRWHSSLDFFPLGSFSLFLVRSSISRKPFFTFPSASAGHHRNPSSFANTNESFFRFFSSSTVVFSGGDLRVFVFFITRCVRGLFAPILSITTCLSFSQRRVISSSSKSSSEKRERERDYVRSLSLSLTLSECVSREAKEERYEENV